jgi:hypothetical protein
VTWDLAKALHKKAEVESARLQAFNFRLRARTIALLAGQHGLDPAALVAELAVLPDAEMLAGLCRQTGQAEADVRQQHASAATAARQQLLAELGDPSPHRLA